MSDSATFHHVLVVGAVKTGKTSLLSSLCHTQVSDYEPTVVATKFIDVQRKIIFIDTPGVKDVILCQSTNLRESNQNRFLAFQDDTLVKELRGSYVDASNYKVFRDPYCCSKIMNNMNSIDAVVILYTDCKFSQKVAKALRFMYHKKLLEEENNKHPGADSTSTHAQFKVFTLHVNGDFSRKDVLAEDYKKLLQLTSQRDDKGRVANYAYFQDIESIYNEEPVFSGKAKYETCGVLPDVHLGRESSIDEAFFRLQTQLGVVYNVDDDDGGKNENNTGEEDPDEPLNNREQCSSCVIS